MPEPIVRTTEEGQEEGQQQQPIEGQTPQQEQQEKLYAGRFKTPEELEEHYKLSSNEGRRLAQEVQSLKQQLQNATTPKQAEAIQDKIDDLTKFFDADTAKVLDGWFSNRMKKEFEKFQSETRTHTEFQGEVQKSWDETTKLYPEVANPQSKLYQRANEILFERKLAEVGSDGVVKLLTPFAYRIAVEAAVVELGRQAPQDAESRTKKSQATSIQGRSSVNTPKTKLTYEQYQKLSDEEKNAYDEASRKQ